MSTAETSQQAADNDENRAKVGVDVPVDDYAAEDPLLMCLAFLTKFHGRPRSADVLRAGLPYADKKMSPSLFLRAAERAGLTGRVVKRRLAAIPDLVLPTVVLLDGDQAWVIIERTAGGNFVVMNPDAGGGTHQMEPKALNQQYTGYAIFVRPEFRFGAQQIDSDVPRPRAWFWGTLARSWWIYIQVGMAAIMVNLFALATPLFVMNVYDRVLPNNAIETGWVLAIGVITVFVFDFLLRTLRAVFVDFAGKRADVILACRIFDQVLDMKMEHRPQSAGAFASTLREFETLRDFFTSATLVAFIDLPFVFLFVLVIWFIGGQLAFVLLISITLVLGVGLLIQLPLRYLVQKNLKEGENKHGVLVESLNGLETIKSIGAESRMRLLWEGFVSQSATSSQRARFFANLATTFAFFIQQMTTVAVVLVGIFLVAEGELTVGGLIACVILSGRALGPLGAAAQLMTRYHQAMTSLRSLNAIMEKPTERPPDKMFLHRPHLRGEISFENVSFSYPNADIEVLKDISFKIRAGETVGFVGRVGSGKTTVAKMIIGLYPPTKGTILIDGTDIRQIDPVDLRRNVGYVPQDLFLFRGTVRDNITIAAPYADDADTLKVAQLAGIDDFISQHPKGYDLPVGERGDGLSGGQRQSIAVARALLRRPNILIMDEPTSSMDTRSEDVIKKQLPEVIAEKTLVLITHRSSLLSLVERLIVFDRGRIVADGPRESVLESLASGRIATSR